jgi:hypothetical protein
LVKWCLLSLLLPATAGCNLGFEKETVVVAFPPDRDEVRILLVYEGFHSVRDGKSDLEKAKKELSGLMASEHEFRLGSWPLIFTLSHEKDEREEARKFRDFARQHVTIHKGGFFQVAGGNLNGYQTLTIREARKFVRGANDAFSEHLAREIPEEFAKPKLTCDLFDRTSLELILQAAREKHTWVKLEPGRVHFTFPGTQALFDRTKRGALQVPQLEELHKVLKKGEDESALTRLAEIQQNAAWLSQLPLSFDVRKDRMILSLGFGEGEPIYLRMPENPGLPARRDKELTAHAKTLKVQFRENETVESIVAEFLKEAQKAN